MKIIKPSPKALNRAVSVIKKGGVLVCPTDTVYGFLADAGNRKAVESIFKIKKRAKSNPLPIFVADMAMAKMVAEIDDKHMQMLKKSWPGKYTFILPRKKMAIFGVRRGTIAIRIPKYSFLNALLKKIKKPLVQTSINISKQPPIKTVENIMKVFGKNKKVSLFIDGGDMKKARSSTILDLTKKKMVRLR